MITFRRKGEDIIGNGLFRAPKKKEMHCMYGRVGEGGSDCIIEIRIPPSCLVIDMIRNKEMK